MIGMQIKIKAILKNVFLLTITLLVTLEIFSALAVRLFNLPADLPNYKIPAFKPFWSDINPIWGVWHEPHSRYDHVRKCYRAVYTANSHGMRDKDREIDSQEKRIIVLGDSFTEGFGLKDEERWTNMLEKQTGIPHLNFGNAGIFGPTQYMLLYKNFARKFRHDGIIIGLFPGNDFLDDSPKFGHSAFGHRYRPYLAKTSDGYELNYFNKAELGDAPERQKKKSFWRGTRQIFRNFTHSANVIEYTIGLMRQWSGTKIHGRRFIFDYSGYSDYTKEDWDRFSHVFQQLRTAAGDRPILIVLIPRPGDFLYLKQGKNFTLQKDLKNLISQYANTSMIDLLPVLAEPEDWKQYYQICDGHWTPLANRLAAEKIERTNFYHAFRAYKKIKAGR